MKRLFLATAIGTLALTAQAAAQPMPNYDISVFCTGAGRQLSDEKRCVEMQYLWRGVVSDWWTVTKPEVIAECVAVADRWRDYSTLNGCMSSHRRDAKVQ